MKSGSAPLGWRSLQVRLTLLSLSVFLAAVWSLAGYAHRRLHQDIEHMLGQQQLATAALHASEIDRSLAERLDTLERVTRLMPSALLAQPKALQIVLAERPALPSLFNGGYFVTDSKGVAIASVPVATGRLGRPYGDYDFVQSALQDGKSKISQPMRSPTRGNAVFFLAVAIKGEAGQVSGALVGVIDLAGPNFLDRLMSARYGSSGGYTLIARQSRSVVTANDKSRMLEVLPAPGQNAAIDEYLSQPQATRVLVSPKGVEMLVSLADVPVAGWALSAELPTREAFAPIDNLANNIMVTTLLVSLLAGAATWWLVRRQLNPVYLAYRALSAQTPLKALPRASDDEIGHLIDGFNTALQTVAQREAALSANQLQLTQVAQRLSEAQHLAAIGSWSLDLLSGMLEWSDEVYRIFEIELHGPAPTYQAFLDRVHPDDRSAVDQAYTQSLKDRSFYEIEHRLLLPGGRIKWVHERGHSEFDPQGRALTSVGTIQDITERKLNEFALAASRDLLTTVIDTIPMRVFWKDPQLRYLGCNTLFARDAGKQLPSELIGQDDLQQGWAEQAELYRADDQTVIASGVPKLFYEEPQKTPDGRTIWLRTSKIPLKARNGSIVGVLGIYEDVSDRKNAEDQLRKLSLVAEQSPESVLITDLDGTIEYVNASFVQNTGYSRDEALGQNPRLLDSGLNPPGAFQDMWQQLSQGKPWRGELMNRHKDGSLYDDSVTITPLRNDLGQVTHYVSSQENITDKKRLAQEIERNRNRLQDLVRERTEELNTAREQAEAANQAKSDFLANMSHEIRTPMNGVVGMVDILRQSGLNSAQLRMVDTVGQSALSLLGILNDILDFSKIEAGKLDLDLAPTALRDVAEEAAQLMRSTAQQQGVALSLFVDPSLPPWILSDGLRLRQILLNLLGNAIKFSARPQSRQVALHVQPVTHADSSLWLELVVADNGIGMSPEVVERLFQPFSQADARTVRSFGGTGLGLSITQRLVQMMDGQIQVQSSPGQGSRFTICLPLMAAVVPDEQTLLAMPDVHGVTVLAIAPQLACQTTLQVYLGSGGARLQNLPDLASAASALAHQPPDTVLLLDQTRRCEDPDPAHETWRDDPRVVWLVTQPGDQVRGSEVQAQPLLYRDLLEAVAQASGRLPRPSTDVDSPAPERKAPSIAQAAQQGELILMAEDNETNRDVMHQQLRLLGYAAEMAADGVQALQMWQSGRFALLLTDCHMPNMDGYDLTAAIRQAEQGKPRKPIVAITANATQGEAARCLSCGMDDYLSKPLRLQQLAAMLAKWLPQASASAAPDQATPASPPPPEATSAPSTPSVAVFNAATLPGMVGHNSALVHQLLTKFLRNTQLQVQDIGAAMVKHDLARVATLAHTLKSAARSVGALALGELCQLLETAGRAADAPACMSLALALPDAFAAVELAITSLEAATP